jgi:hypothetical protein
MRYFNSLFALVNTLFKTQSESEKLHKYTINTLSTSIKMSVNLGARDGFSTTLSISKICGDVDKDNISAILTEWFDAEPEWRLKYTINSNNTITFMW